MRRVATAASSVALEHATDSLGPLPPFSTAVLRAGTGTKEKMESIAKIRSLHDANTAISHAAVDLMHTPVNGARGVGQRMRRMGSVGGLKSLQNVVDQSANIVESLADYHTRYFTI